MKNLEFLKKSLDQLNKLTDETYSSESSQIAKELWYAHLQKDNPLWKHLEAKPFIYKNKRSSAHIIAFLDSRLPGIGLVGYFACTDASAGADVLKQATEWLHKNHGVKDIYGPINGTATSDYRLNLREDFQFPGEPVNPSCQIDAFEKAGFTEFNRYVSAETKYYRILKKILFAAPKVSNNFRVRPFDTQNQTRDLKHFHGLMTTIFPKQSVYCPKLSWEERAYGFKHKDPFFNPSYMWFLEYNNNPIGLINAYPHEDRLVVKTIGILPKYRGKKLSHLLIRKVHDQASKDGLKTATYAMVRVGNSAYKMKKPGIKINRHYMTMKKSF